MAQLTGYFDNMASILPEFDKIKVIAIAEGFSNKVYRLDWNKAPRMILRIPALDEAAFCIDRQSEMAVLLSAAQAGISPSVLWYDDSGAFASQFVVQPTLSWEVKHDNGSITKIAKVLAKAHDLPAISHPFCIYDVVEHYLQSVEAFVVDRPEIKEELAYLRELQANLPRVEDRSARVVCHNDLNPKNVLMDNQATWLIDWEYAGMGDPLFDLALVARSHHLSQEQQIHLIQGYDDTLAIEETLLILGRYGLAYSLREMVWLLLKHLTTPNDPEAWSFYVDFKNMPSLNPFLGPNEARSPIKGK